MQRRENNDAEKLRSLGLNDKDCSRITADIPGVPKKTLRVFKSLLFLT